MKVKYIGQSFLPLCLTDGKVYNCLGAEVAGEFGVTLRVIDDSGEDYLYSAQYPKPWTSNLPAGRWEVIEDDENGTLRKAIYKGIVE